MKNSLLKKCGVVAVIFLFVGISMLSAAGSLSIEATTSEENGDLNVDNKVYVEPNKRLTLEHIEYLGKALPYMRDSETKQIVFDIITEIHEKGYVDSRDIQRIVENYDTDITAVNILFKIKTTGYNGNCDGYVLCFPGLIRSVFGRFLLRNNIAVAYAIYSYTACQPPAESFGWNFTINDCGVSKGRGHIIGYFGRVRLNIFPNQYFMLDGSAILIFYKAFGYGWNDKASMPEGRADCSGAVVDDKLYVFGGYANGAGDVRQNTYAYDPASDSWMEKASVPGNHTYVATSCACETKVYVFGGLDGKGTNYKTLYIYDTVNDSWSTGADFPVNIGISSASSIAYNGKIYIIGGWRDGDPSGNVTVYDPPTDTYDTCMAAMPTPRGFFSLSEVNGSLYAIGGGGRGEDRFLNVNEVYDVANDSWTTKAPLPFCRWGLARENAAINGKIYISHGMPSDRKFSAYACEYDTVTDTWQIITRANHPKDGHVCGVIDGKLYAVGGRDRDWPLTPMGISYNEQLVIGVGKKA